jgi:hypothetical protein
MTPQPVPAEAGDNVVKAPLESSSLHDLDGSEKTINTASEESVRVQTAAEFGCWPEEPEELGKWSAFKLLSDIADWVLVLTPAIFIGKPRIMPRDSFTAC